MTTTLYQDIRGALQQRAASATGYPPVGQRAYEGGPLFSSTNGTPYARTTLMPTSGRPFEVSGGTKQHAGLFQVDVCVPSNQGTATAEIAADNVKAMFEPGDVLLKNGEHIVIDYAERGKAMVSPDWIFCPVTVRWRCFSTRN